MSIYEYIGDRLRVYRDERNLSQSDLAMQLGTHANTISRWETATYKPSLDDLQMLATFFDIPLTAFLPTENRQYDRGRRDAYAAMHRWIEAVDPIDSETVTHTVQD